MGSTHSTPQTQDEAHANAYDAFRIRSIDQIKAAVQECKNVLMNPDP